MPDQIDDTLSSTSRLRPWMLLLIGLIVLSVSAWQATRWYEIWPDRDCALPSCEPSTISLWRTVWTIGVGLGAVTLAAAGVVHARGGRQPSQSNSRAGLHAVLSALVALGVVLAAFLPVMVLMVLAPQAGAAAIVLVLVGLSWAAVGLMQGHVHDVERLRWSLHLGLPAVLIGLGLVWYQLVDAGTVSSTVEVAMLAVLCSLATGMVAWWAHLSSDPIERDPEPIESDRAPLL